MISDAKSAHVYVYHGKYVHLSYASQINKYEKGGKIEAQGKLVCLKYNFPKEIPTCSHVICEQDF
jgi:hypothetical protein